MATLTGQSIASSYEQLLHVDTDGGGNTTTLVPIKDGDNDTTFCLQLSTTKAMIEGSGSKLFFSDEGGEYISGDGTDLTITSGGAVSIDASPLSFSGASTIDTSGNNLLTLDGGTAGVRLDNVVGINADPIATTMLYSNAAHSSTTTTHGINWLPTLTTTGSGAGVYGATFGASTLVINNASAHNVANVRMRVPTVTETAGTIGVASTLLIEGAPSTGGTDYAIFVDEGDCRFDGDLIMADGKGINFAAMTTPADAAGMTAETLTDYEEGTFTPIYVSSGASFSYATQWGAYTKIGRMVYFDIYLISNSASGGTAGNAVYIGGLPFTCIGSKYSLGGNVTSTSQWGGDFPTTGMVVQAGTTMQLFYFDYSDGHTITTKYSDMATSTSDNYISIYGFYQV